jgi:sugar O-acyltransferase (sialic acid O-acetyltransferase NeuD family)
MNLLIIGTGETAALAYEYFSHDSSYEVIGFSVDGEYLDAKTFCGLPLIALENIGDAFPAQDCHAFVALSSGHLNRDRTILYNNIKKSGYKLASYISSKAFVWKNVEIGDNCFILEDNTLQPFVKIGNNVTLWSGNHIGHRSIIGNNCFISSHVVISGFCEVKEYCFIGVNSTIADNIVIEKDNFIALGSVINKNTEENKIYRGNPAVAATVSAKRFCKVKE